MTRQAPGLSIGSASDRVETRHCFPDFTGVGCSFSQGGLFLGFVGCRSCVNVSTINSANLVDDCGLQSDEARSRELESGRGYD